MLLSRDYVAYMAGEVVKRLLAAKMIETPSADALAQRCAPRCRTKSALRTA